MRQYRLLPALLVSGMLGAGCAQLFDPENDNHSTFDRIYQDPSYAEGLLIRAYTYIPTNDYRYDEYATDDAVTNDFLNGYLRIATGEWSAINNPQNLWNNCNRGILYINQFLGVVEDVKWKPTDKEINDLFVRRLTGESYALKGLLKYFLLRNHAGFGTSGQLLGIPVYDHFTETREDFSTPRASFADALKSAYDDLDKALTYLPDDYGNVTTVPAGFDPGIEVASYNYTFGDAMAQRISGRHVRALKARLALLAASPAFNTDNDVTLWERAANLTADVLDGIDGVNGLDPVGHKFYLPAQINTADISSDRKDLPEILWRRPIYTNRSRESNHFPPSLYGNGRMNPTQNLVDAFPMKNGYPIGHPDAGYDAANPYAGRDPRLALYIVYDGSSLKNTAINTGVNAGSDGLNAQANSTRTGYYLRKLLREDVNVNPASASNQKHFNTHIRYTELFLNYAEAANEAWGPASSPRGYTARDVIGAIRRRAGITQPDAYLNAAGTQGDMRTLIRNERRLELCFESFRFWDLRRWKADLTEPARGVRIENGTYSYFNVEERAYENEYMHYGPIPNQEVVRFNLEQNAGW